MPSQSYRGYLLVQLEQCVAVYAHGRIEKSTVICTSHTMETAKQTVDEREAFLQKYYPGRSVELRLPLWKREHTRTQENPPYKVQ